MTVLAIGAHPDDVELFCGGIVIRLGQLGHQVGVADLTRGEKASHGTPDERARETAAASAELGLAFRDNLGLPDTELAPVPAQLAAVVELLRRRRPELVLAPWREDRHPDHIAAFELVTRACMLAGVRNFAPETGERFVPGQLLYYASRHRMTASFVVDTAAAAAQKAKAIACYATQIRRRPGDDPTLEGVRRACSRSPIRSSTSAQTPTRRRTPSRASRDPLALARRRMLPRPRRERSDRLGARARARREGASHRRARDRDARAPARQRRAVRADRGADLTGVRARAV
jgi:bacillithiol biosynthesis deacetylase BshB1